MYIEVYMYENELLHPQKLASYFSYLPFFFLSFFRFSLRVTTEDKATVGSSMVLIVGAPHPTAIIQQHHTYQQQQEARACVFV